jgi:hypothetical protein
MDYELKFYLFYITGKAQTQIKLNELMHNIETAT